MLELLENDFVKQHQHQVSKFQQLVNMFELWVVVLDDLAELNQVRFQCNLWCLVLTAVKRD